MADKKAEIIHEYEELKNIPLDFRYTEYVEAYSSYMIKMGLDPEKIQDRYNLALLDRAQQNQDEFQGIMEITLQHNIPDTAVYALINIDAMFENFMNRDEKVRRIGIKRKDEEPIYLLKIRDTDILPEFVPISDNMPDIDYLENIRHEWFVKTVYLHEHNLEEQTKKLLNISGSKLSPKQEKYNYGKELKRKIKNCSILRDEQMEEFDFRSIQLSGYIFINCNLKNSNFSYVNLEGASFINCNLEGALFYGAQLNGCMKYTCDPTKVIDIYKRYA